jgi:hypothetical protein
MTTSVELLAERNEALYAGDYDCDDIAEDQVLGALDEYSSVLSMDQDTQMTCVFAHRNGFFQGTP